MLIGKEIVKRIIEANIVCMKVYVKENSSITSIPSKDIWELERRRVLTASEIKRASFGYCSYIISKIQNKTW